MKHELVMPDAVLAGSGWVYQRVLEHLATIKDDGFSLSVPDSVVDEAMRLIPWLERSESGGFVGWASYRLVNRNDDTLTFISLLTIDVVADGYRR